MFYKFLDGDKAPIAKGLNIPLEYIDKFTYKIDEVNICKDFDELNNHGGGFYFSDEKNILNFLGYGTLVYDVIVPEDAKVIHFFDEVEEFKTDKIILTNPREVTVDFVKDMLSKGAEISNAKIIGVLGDLISKKELSMAELIFNTINPNDAEIADYIINFDEINSALNFPYIQKYSQTTNPGVIASLYRKMAFQKQYGHQPCPAEQLILSKIRKNIGKPVKEVVNEYLKSSDEFDQIK